MRAWARSIRASSTRWRGRGSSRAATSASGFRRIRCRQKRRWRWSARSSTFSRRRCCCRARSPICCSSARTARHRDRSRPAGGRARAAPAVQADLRRFDLGTVREIVGTFVGSARNLADATRDSAPVTDDRPMQEYSVRSLLNTRSTCSAAVGVALDLSQIPAWCPRCFVDGKPVPLVDGIDTYLDAARSVLHGAA